ncbi:50S ribosome-binding GTPase [Shimia gijangensis]|uniref:50S ribosome-binding GTPase n=1 Tax=Shimia gijangensis TaxID=1470563 RepID=A0A1M6TD13_9RHOB|nr:AAA family ATPase [Shimia gijangensis]SHK54668.1 50S ribosome-binding GTPase [Shimia gijangensis]
MEFHVIGSRVAMPSSGIDTVYLKIDHWNDYSFVTMFEVQAFDERGTSHELPNVKIGFVGQTDATSTHQALDANFSTLPEGFFSLGTNVEFYKDLRSNFSTEWRTRFLVGLKDVVHNPEILKQAENESVFQTSLLRSANIKDVRDQFVSVLRGEVLLTDFHFGFDLPSSDKFAGYDLEFVVRANSTPSTNMHALIGRNGVGKTTLLNSMVRAIARSSETDAQFYTDDILLDRQAIGDEYFSSLISIAFSAFDPFDLPPEPDGTEVKTHYSYIGLTDYADEGGAIIKSKKQLHQEFAKNLEVCLAESGRKNRWQQAMSVLESDGNFAEMDLQDLAELDGEELKKHALFVIGKMSSGHAIVILTLTCLVAKIQEKTLVLFDEPESHLHPPLLSALMRSLSQLLSSRNAIAIFATHSPVVLQEIPKSCVWKVYRSKLSSDWARPETDTFGENVGTLTREVFGLEVTKSGFHTVLTDLVSDGGSYGEILGGLEGNLGFEAKGILRAMIVNRDGGIDHE